MNIISHIKNIINSIRYKVMFKVALLSALIPNTFYLIPIALLLLTSCIDDTFDNHSDINPGQGSINLDEYMAVPLAINYGSAMAFTKAADSEFENGTSHDHHIDFNDGHESFAIFFTPKPDNNNKIVDKFLTVKRLQSYNTLGNGGDPQDGIGEYAIYTLAYLHRDSIPEEGLKVLVVLNGGRIYNQLYKEDSKLGAISNYLVALSEQDWARDEDSKLLLDENGNTYRTPINTNITGQIDKITADDFLDFIWVSKFSSDGVIGINNDKLFTMTNSAYFGPDDERATNVLERNYKLQTVRTIDMSKIFEAKVENMKPSNVAATIYVERMVAKFSPPVFSTQVIGSERFFRPSQNALSMIIYGFNSKNEPISEQRNWRVHVTGWTINGREKGNYLYKHIKQAWGTEQPDGTYDISKQQLTNWDRVEWNDPSRRRSYWSIDPHYKNTNDFYPWQFREALDNPGHSLNQYTDIQESHDEEGNLIYDYNIRENSPTALRYFNYRYLSQYWSEEPLTISENTFDPDTYLQDSHNSYDDRAEILVGPHLLVGAEVYVEDPNAKESEFNYIGQFVRPEHLYSDRLGRFYFDELSWFKMFIRDFNNALKAQNHMTVTIYDWDQREGSIYDSDKIRPGANESRFTVYPSGDCKLYYDPEANGNILPEGDKRTKYAGEILTLDLLDEMIKDGVIDPATDLSIESNLRNSDGKRIPWLEGLVVRKSKEERLRVFPASYTDDQVENQDSFIWTDDMRKSLFYEWFGEVNHYFNGYMYYASPIIHHMPSGVQSNRYYYGAVRNHWYTFTVTSINALGIPVDNIWQPIIPGKYNYEGMISCYIDIIDWHSMNSDINYN